MRLRQQRKAGRGEALPCPFGVDLPGPERLRVEGWWEALPARDRRELAALSDPGADRCARRRGSRPDGASGWHGASIRVRGVFADGDGGEREEAFPVDLYEYLVAHEIVLISERVYHVCTRHEAARRALRTGQLPASFTCPLDRPECPMRRLLALRPGGSLRFEST